MSGDEERPVPEADEADERESAYELLQRGHALMKGRHNAQAAIVLERAARLEPGKGSILEALGRAQFNGSQHERAAETFERLLEVDPSSHYGHFALGQSLKQVGRMREARTHLRLAVALSPTSTLYAGALARLPTMPDEPAMPGAVAGGPTAPAAPVAPAAILAPGSIRAVVFDFDGLLVDSEQLWVDAERRLLAEHGHRYTEEDEIEGYGRAPDMTVELYSARLGLDPVAVRDDLMGRMQAAYAAGPPLRPGARELVEALSGRIPLAVASNTDSHLVRAALDGGPLGRHLPVVVSPLEAGRGKPHPDVYLLACRTLGVEPEAALAFEDSPTGARAAKAAGMTVIAVPDRFANWEAGHEPDLVIGSLAELLEGEGQGEGEGLGPMLREALRPGG